MNTRSTSWLRVPAEVCLTGANYRIVIQVRNAVCVHAEAYYVCIYIYYNHIYLHGYII